MGCCKVKTDDTTPEKEGNKVLNSFIVVLIALMIFPIIYMYVVYLLGKQLITGKTNKISEIANDLIGAIKAFKNYKPEVEEEDEYYDLNEDLELESLIKDEDEKL